ncbi:hypothetical protein [Telluribacter sp. SYSU D00476]|uniref:hypothetical protein n=1 Tax=Telluribacter sp. SYSU D00476 TaxID=2811430 RepID=UPI001FF362E4|nr:hypothetical protein [Telluribacter sp. SYSU D00476]
MKNLCRNLMIACAVILISFQSSAPERAGLIGRWSKYPGFVWELYHNRTFSLSIGYGIHMFGKYSADGNRLVLSKQSGTLLAMLCGIRSSSMKASGDYYFEMDKGNLVITQYNEGCKEQKGEIPGTYHRI